MFHDNFRKISLYTFLIYHENKQWTWLYWVHKHKNIFVHVNFNMGLWIDPQQWNAIFQPKISSWDDDGTLFTWKQQAPTGKTIRTPDKHKLYNKKKHNNWCYKGIDRRILMTQSSHYRESSVMIKKNLWNKNKLLFPFRILFVSKLFYLIKKHLFRLY